MRFYTNVSRRGSNMLLLGRDERGQRFEHRIKYRPYLFLETHGSSQYKTAIGELPVRKKIFDSVHDANEYIKTFADVENSVWYGSERWLYNFINDEFPGKIEYDISKIKVGYFDIEVKSDNGFPNPAEAKEPVRAITLSDGKEFYTFGLKAYLASESNVQYTKCDSEAQLLALFLDKWEELELDVISGWNSSGFDIPFMYNRIKNVLGDSAANRLSPFRSCYFREGFDRIGRSTIIPNIDGIANLDFYNLYQKFTYSKQEQYTLDYISKAELGESKLGYAEFGSLERLYEQDFQRYIDYNIQDVRLVIGLEQKMKLIELAMTLAYTAKVNYEDSMTSVLLWDVIIHNYLMERGLVVPKQNHNSKEQAIAGAYVKDPKIGLYHWIITFDAASLYPSLIRQLNISPDKFAGMVFNMTPSKMLDKDAWVSETTHAQKHGFTVAGNGAAFRNDKQGFIPALMEEYFNSRSAYSKQMIECQKQAELEPKNKSLADRIVQLNSIQMAIKIALNSCYGAMTNPGFRYYSNELAEAITLSGQVVAQWAANHVNEFLNKVLKTTNEDYVIASDTDSIMINLQRVVEDKFGKNTPLEEAIAFLDDFGKKCLSVVLDRAFDDLAKRMNAIEKTVVMNREAIADKGVWVGKKRYALQIWNNKGVSYKKPKMKITGIECVRSSTPTICRPAIKEAINIIISGDNDALQQYLKSFKQKHDAAPMADIAHNSSVNKLSHYRDKNKAVPIAVKAALNFNDLLVKFGIQAKYPLIDDGYKIKFVNLKEPNKHRMHVFGFPGGILPSELAEEFEKLVDRDRMYEDNFIKPISKIAEACHVSLRNEATLADFFS